MRCPSIRWIGSQPGWGLYPICGTGAVQIGNPYGSLSRFRALLPRHRPGRQGLDVARIKLSTAPRSGRSLLLGYFLLRGRQRPTGSVPAVMGIVARYLSEASRASTRWM